MNSDHYPVSASIQESTGTYVKTYVVQYAAEVIDSEERTSVLRCVAPTSSLSLLPIESRGVPLEVSSRDGYDHQEYKVERRKGGGGGRRG